MPSLPHEILVEVVRSRPSLACELLELCAGIRLEAVTVEAGSNDATQIAPAEYRSDCVSVARDARGVAIAAVIAECQLAPDSVKRRTWPIYLASARARLDCPVMLLVIVPDRAVARWARKPIELGHPGFRLVPIVVCLEDLPRLTALAPSQRTPELALLCTLGHPEVDEAEAALEVIHAVPDDRARLYWDSILSHLPTLARQTLESRMQGHKYQSDFARKYYDQGLDEGVEKGLQHLQQAVLELARAKIGAVADDIEAWLRAQRDPDALTRLTVALGQARDAAEARAAIDAAIAART